MIPDLSCAPRLPDRPVPGQFGQPGPRRMLEVDEGVLGQPAPALEPLGGCCGQARIERRIEKHDIEGHLPLAETRLAEAPPAEPGECIRTPHVPRPAHTPARTPSRPRCAARRRDGSRQRRRGLVRAPFPEDPRKLPRSDRVPLDELHGSRPAGERLEPERAAPREQIEAARTRNGRAEPVEERLAHAIGGRADGALRREAQPPSAPCAADDAQHARLRAAPRRSTPAVPVALTRIRDRFAGHVG